MDDAVRTRAAARRALSDIEPTRLRAVLEERLVETSMTPGALTLASARAMGSNVDDGRGVDDRKDGDDRDREERREDDRDSGFDRDRNAGYDDGLTERAAGVQLIYEGLRLTRTLAQAEPWDPDATDETNLVADLDILAADVLVSRGFYLLARTDAADAAVETVRSFGRDQTRKQRPDVDRSTIDRNLEADVFELAIVAGAAGVDGAPSEELLSFAAELARGYDGDRLPPARDTISERTTDRIASLTDGLVRSSATDA
ncbi:MAG: DUF7114 family protein [Halobacteriota archaeon]